MTTDGAHKISAMKDQLRQRPDPARPGSKEPGEDAFRHAMSRFATGVTVITALDPQGELCGLTANAFSSVSLNPPLVLSCLSYDTRCYEAIRASGCFSIHILKSDQDDIARGFAAKGGNRSTVCGWQINERGLPLLETFDTAFECGVYEAYPGGDHAILVGQVEAIHVATELCAPLLYYLGRMLPLRLDR